MALIAFSTGDHDNPGFVEKVKQLVFPDLEPDNLQFPHARFIQNGLLAAQTFVECLRSNNVNFYDLDDVTVSCKIATLTGPEHARIQSIYAYKPGQKCTRYHYEQTGVGAISCYGEAKGCCVTSESAADIVFNSVMSGVAFCNQDDVVISESSFKCCERIFAKGACDKIYLAPMFPCDWRLAVHWEGIKRRYENTDLIADDEDLIDVISLWLRGERAGWIDRDLETQQLIMRKPARAGDWGGTFWQRLMDMKHRCREERRLRRNYLCDAIFDDNALVDPCDIPVPALECGVNQYEAADGCHDCFTPVVTIEASEATIESDDSVTIYWTSLVPDIDSSIVTVEYGSTVTVVDRNADGSIVLNPQADTTYTIRAVTVCGTVTATVSVSVTVVVPCVCPDGLPDCFALNESEPSEIFLACGNRTITTDGYGAIPWDGTLPKLSDCRYGYEGEETLYIQPSATPVSPILELVSCDPYNYRLTFGITQTPLNVRLATNTISPSDFYAGNIIDGVVLEEGDRVLFIDGLISQGQLYGACTIYVATGPGGVMATDADTYDELFYKPYVLVSEGETYAWKYFHADLTQDDLNLTLVKFDQVSEVPQYIWQGEQQGTPFGEFVSVNHGEDVGCFPETDFTVGACEPETPCVNPEVTFDPPAGSHVSFPTLVFLHSTNNTDSIYYGVDEDAIHLYDGNPISLAAGQVLTAKSFTVLGCLSETVTSDYVDDGGLEFVFVCDPPQDKAGIFGEFHANGVANDYHWRIKPSRTSAWTLRNVKIYETNSAGVWVTGQVWSTVSPVYPTEIAPAAYASYPLVVLNGAVQLNTSYTDPLDSYPIGAQTLDAYGQPAVPLTGYFRLELTIDEGGSPFTIYKLIPHACAPADCAAPAAPALGADCTASVFVSGTVPAGSTFKILEAKLPPCGTGAFTDVVTGISVSGAINEILPRVNGCSYSYIISVFCPGTLEWLNSGQTTVTVPSPCAVNCVLSPWTEWIGTSDWTECSGGVQTRTEQRTRTVITPASYGGTPCGPLSETRTSEQACSTQCFIASTQINEQIAAHPVLYGSYDGGGSWSATPTVQAWEGIHAGTYITITGVICGHEGGAGNHSWILTFGPTTGAPYWAGYLDGESPIGSYTPYAGSEGHTGVVSTTP